MNALLDRIEALLPTLCPHCGPRVALTTLAWLRSGRGDEPYPCPCSHGVDGPPCRECIAIERGPRP